jgi:antitoxin ParD1/3/4
MANFAIGPPAANIRMPTRNISLTAEQNAFVEEVVDAGEYQNASEAVRDALRVLQQRRQEDALKLELLQAQVEAGIDALDRGDFIEIDDAALDRYLGRRSGRRRKRKR